MKCQYQAVTSMTIRRASIGLRSREVIAVRRRQQKYKRTVRIRVDVKAAIVELAPGQPLTKKKTKSENYRDPKPGKTLLVAERDPRNRLHWRQGSLACGIPPCRFYRDAAEH